MAQSQVKAASENDLAPAGEETLDFDDGTLRGERFYQNISIYKTNKIRLPFPSAAN